ncbi:MAG: DUF2723 domain-containing protein, partial [Candidatus Desantisbacteria bacterium]
QAVIAEKYTLNAFFFTLLIFILLKWEESKSKIQNLKSKIYLCLFSFLLGLSFCHHFQTIYLVPGSIFFVLAISWKNRKKFKAQSKKSFLLSILKTQLSRFVSLPARSGLPLSLMLKIALLFILPITLWIYLPLRANQQPILNWGDPSNWDNLIIHITGQTYGIYFSSIKGSFSRLVPHLNFFPSQFSLYLLWIGLMAIPILLWRKLTIFLLFALIFVANIIHSIRYTIVNIQDYYLPSFILSAILIGFGLSFITRLTPKHLKPIFLLFLLLPLIPYHTNYFQNNRSKSYFAYDYGMNILKPLKEDAIIFSYGDYDTFPPDYLLYVEGRRRDITALCWTFLPCDWHIESIENLHSKVSFPFNKIAIKNLKYCDLQAVRRERLQKIILENLFRFPIYVGSGVKQEGGIEEGYLFLPDSFFFRLMEKETDKDRLKVELEGRPQFFLRGMNNKIFKDRVASEIIGNYSLSYNERGNLWQGIDIDRAILEYKNALAISPSYPPSQLNLGFAYINKKDYDRAMEVFIKVAEENPNYNPS